MNRRRETKRSPSAPATRRQNRTPRLGWLSEPVPRPLWRFPATNVGDQAPCLAADELTPRERQVARYVALGAWHHDGDQLPGRTRDQMRAVYGPSFKHHAREFRIWTADVLPGFAGIGTEAWQAWQDAQLRLRNAA